MPIRLGTPADLPAVLPMVAKICAQHEAWDAAKYGFLPNPERRYQGWLTKLATDDRGLFLVAEETNQAIGFLVATVERELPVYRLQKFGFIHDLWVEAEYRRSGVGRQLVMFAIERFKQMGIEQVRLDTVLANETARQMFSACGFRPSIIEMLLDLGSQSE